MWTRELRVIAMQLIALFASFAAWGQTNPGDNVSPEGEYYKQNTAITEFVRLGVNAKQYAKCVKNINFLDPEKDLNVLLIGKETFRDDGEGNDIVANDGVLTSVNLYFYDIGETVLASGSYSPLRDEDYIVVDDSFNHDLTARVPFPKIRVKCTFRWVPCNQMSHPANLICQAMGSPYGSLMVTDCEVQLSW